MALLMMNDDPQTPHQVEKIKPRFIPFKCVNCNGYGSTSFGKNVCRVCQGKGYIVVDQEKPAVNGGGSEN